MSEAVFQDFRFAGKGVNTDECPAVLQSSEFISRVTSHLVQVLPEHGETPLFKQLFRDRRDPEDAVGMGTVYVSNQIAKIKKVDPSSSSLNSNNVFVLVSSSGSWMWKGRSSSSAEVEGAEHLAGILPVTPTVLEEEEEEEEEEKEGAFWEVFGGLLSFSQAEEADGRSSSSSVRLLQMEVPGEPTQNDLAPDVMILDTWDQVFVWIGNEAHEEKMEERRLARRRAGSD